MGRGEGRGVTIAEDWGSDEADQDGEVTLNIPEEHFFPWSPDTPFYMT